MSFDSEFISLQKKKKKKKENEAIAPVKADPFFEELINLQQKNIDKQLANRKKVEANGTGYFKKTRGTVAEKILGTGADVATTILQGLGNTGEGIVDLATYGVSNLSKALFGENQFSQSAKEFAQKDLVKTGAEWLGGSNGFGYNSSSVLGNKTESIAQGLGQILGMYITAGIGGKLGLAEKGVSALNTGVLFASSTGQGMTEAYKDGATDKEAAAYGVLKGGVEAGSEAIFGGLGKGAKALGMSKGLLSADDILANALTQKITNRVLSNAIQLGVKSTGEGLEEVAAGVGSAIAKKLTYKREKGESLWDLIKDEKLLDSFFAGAITSGIAQSGGAIKSTIKDTDLVSGLTRNEEKVLTSVYEKTIANEEKSKGKKLTSAEKNKIYEQLTKDMERGKISTDDIESVLGGDTYTEYKSRIDQVENIKKKIDTLQKEHDELNAMKKGDMTGVQEDRLHELKKELPKLKSQYKHWTSDTKVSEVADIKARLSNEVASLVQNDRLSESYRENVRKEQHFTADLSKYTEKEAAIVKKAVDSGFLNDSNQTHDFVDLVAKLSAEKGIDFDFTTSKRLKESGFSLEGRVMNGKVDGNTVTINMNSAKALESVVGHEITHILEESPDLYKAVAEAVKQYATTKGDYDSRLEELTELYKDQDADVQKELVADLVGDYIFSDADFVRTLTTNHRNVAQKIYDEIKYMLKLATTGSKEARQLEKAKKAFQDAFRESTSTKTDSAKDSLSSISNSFFGNPEMTVKEFAESDYKSTDGYKNYVEQCVGNMEQTHADFNEKVARKSVEKQIDGIIRVALASAEAGYNIKDTNEQRDTTDQKGRQLFSSLEPNSDYFTSHDVSTICDKSKNFTEIYDEIVRTEQSKGVPKGKGFFDNINNYFYLHKVLADKGLTQPCRQCYVDSMRKNLAPMAKNFLTLIQETDVNNKANDQLYNKSGKNKGQLKSNNAKLRDNVLKILEDHPEYNLTANTITVDMLSTENGLAELRLQAPYVYEAFNSFYGQSKPKMPKSPTPFRFGELTALLTDEHGKIKQNLVDRINSTGGFRLQSYSDFQIANYTDVLQVLFEAGTLGLHGHAYTKVPAFLEATDGTNLKRNISIFMYKDGNEWKIDRNDSFPMALEDIYKIVNADKNGNTGIIAVSQNNDMSAWIMANDNIAYGIPFHKSGHKMGTVRDTDIKTEDGRTVKGYKDAKDHTRQQTEVWKTTTADHKALTKVKKGIDIYQFWDFDNTEGLSHNDLIKKNLKKYIDACEEAGYIPKFRDYVMNNTDILNKTLAYGKKLGFLSEDASIEDISFKYKGYTIPYGYYKFLGDFGMFKPNGEASPIVPISLENYDFDKAVEFFKDAETVRRNEILQQFANDGKRAELRESGMNAEQLQKELAKMRGEVVSQIVDGKKSLSYADATPTTKGTYGKDLLLEDEVIEVETPKAVAPIKAEKTAPTKKVAPIKSQDVVKESQTVAKPSENVANNIPTDSNRKGKVRKFSQSAVESDLVEGRIDLEDLKQEKIYYEPISNKKTLEKANKQLESMEYDKAIEYFNARFNANDISLTDVVVGERLIQEALARDDLKNAGQLIENVAILGTELGRKVQALSIIKKLSPMGQATMLKKVVDRAKTKGDKAFDGVEFTDEMRDEILSAYDGDGITFDQDKLNAAVESVKSKIADKMKTSVGEKLTAWRYLSMLGNPKTHGRNIISNVANMVTTMGKNAIAKTTEDILAKKYREAGEGSPFEYRTKTWKAASKDVLDFARETTKAEKDVLTGNKYSNVKTELMRKRKIFNTKVLQGVYDFNSKALETEDWWFKSFAYKNALAQFLTANGIKTKADIQNNKKLVEKAKKYATEQALIATFQQESWTAEQIAKFENKNLITKTVVGAVLPFKKTPINVAKTALSYSPLGFTKTLTYDIAKIKSGEMNASTLIDHIAQNATGSALVFVGYLLASKGILNGAGDEDKEAKYDYQLGEQSYSINIGGDTYSLSWLSPTAMPLFVGVNMFEQFESKRELNGDVALQTLAQVLDPMSDMSFLSSLNDVLSSYDSGVEKFFGIGKSMAQNYITQYIPTALSQTAAAFDTKKRSTKASGDSGFEFGDETMRKIMYKIPALRNLLEPTTDIWGNDVKQTENGLMRALESYIMPYSKRNGIETDVDTQIKELYNETGEDALIPSIPYDNIKFKGVKYDMSAKNFTEFKQDYGQTAHDTLEDLFATDMYKNADNDEKVTLIKEVYEYARDEAKLKYLNKRMVKYTNTTEDNVDVYRENYVKGAIDKDMPLEEYKFTVEYPEKYKFFTANGITYDDYANADEDGKEAYTWAYNNPEKYVLSQSITSDVKTYKSYTKALSEFGADKYANGKTISGSRKKKVINYINGLGIDEGAKVILYKSEYPSDDDYNIYIVNYLNSRNDISASEMKTILTELGFNVSANGRISW